MITNSSDDTIAPSLWVAVAVSPELLYVAKSSSAKKFSQTMEHSIGVTETFKKGYRFAQEALGSCD